MWLSLRPADLLRGLFFTSLSSSLLLSVVLLVVGSTVVVVGPLYERRLLLFLDAVRFLSLEEEITTCGWEDALGGSAISSSGKKKRKSVDVVVVVAFRAFFLSLSHIANFY